MCAVKLTLDNFKYTRQRQGIAKEGSQLYCYTWKNILLPGINDKTEKIKSTEIKGEKNQKNT